MAFSLEVLVQVLISSQPFGILLIILVQFILVTWSKNIWWSLWGGDVLRTAYKIPFNLTTEELLLILIILTYLVQPIFIVELL
jgi:ABC-type transport system involved in cytochrome c biogenesis permease subunit